MEIQKIILKYYSLKMLLTIDLSKLIEVLILKFGSSLQIDLELMDDSEKDQVTCTKSGILKVNERFWLLGQNQNGDNSRLQELEQKTLEEGKK